MPRGKNWKPPTRGVPIDADLFQQLTNVATHMDVNTTTLVRGILRGALQTGSADRLASVGLADDAVPSRARRRGERLLWVKDPNSPTNPGRVRQPPATWHSGPWTMTKGPKPSDSWYVSGPGFLEPANTGERVRPAAEKVADRLIRHATTKRTEYNRARVDAVLAKRTG